MESIFGGFFRDLSNPSIKMYILISKQIRSAASFLRTLRIYHRSPTLSLLRSVLCPRYRLLYNVLLEERSSEEQFRLRVGPTDSGMSLTAECLMNVVLLPIKFQKSLKIEPHHG